MFLVIGMVVAAGFVSLERASPWVDDEPASVEMSAADGTITLTFQKGDGGAFSETDDTYIHNSAPDTNFGAAPKLLVDATGCKISASTACKTLIKFPLIIGPSDGQIPRHSTIVDARLTLNVKNTGAYEYGEQLTEAWTESGATWNGFANPGMPGIQGATVVFYPNRLGPLPINITSIVQRWADGQTNEGIFLHSDDPDGVDYDSSEAPSGRPTLTVQFVPPPADQPTIVDLGTLPGGDRSVASDLNDAGQVVGWSTNASGATHAVLWADGTITDLGTLPGDISSSAEDINDAGAIVGTSRPAEPGLGHAFLWQDGVMTDLGTLGGSFSYGYGINNLGEVVGASLTASGELHAFLWSNGTMTDLGYPAGYEAFSWAYAINDAGQVVGSITNDGMKGRHGALWEAGVWTDIVGIGVTKWATDINAAGQVVGVSDCCSEAIAWLWDNGTLTDLGTLFPRTGWAKAYGINDAGQIVGDSLSAFRWEDGAMMNLGDFGHGGSVAYGINAAGDAVGSSAVSADGTIHAVLWDSPGGAFPESFQAVGLGTLPGDYCSRASSINDLGYVVGASWDACGNSFHGYIWRDGVMTALGPLPNDTYSNAQDINERDQIVGYSTRQTGDPSRRILTDHAVLWAGGAVTDLGHLAGDIQSDAKAINNRGQVVGISWSSSPNHAFLWEDGVMTALPDWGAGAVANEINDAGQIVGLATDPTYGRLHAVMWNGGSLIDLGTLSGDTWSVALDINDASQVVGWSGDSSGTRHAFLWQDGAMTNLADLADYSVAYGINDAGQVTGALKTGSLLTRAFLWQDGARIDPGDRGYGGAAFGTAINNRGFVVGTASSPTNDATLWIPNGAPPSGPTRLTFQKGDGTTFSETDDTYILSGAPNTNFGTRLSLVVDASGCHFAPTASCKALLAFPNFIGPGAGQVHGGSVIVSATLEFTITNPGGNQFLYQVIEGWTELGATWNGFATPGSPGTKGAGISFGAPSGTIMVNITAIVQNWVNGDPNYGVLIWSNSADGVDYRSSESIPPPKLTVTFSPP